MTDTKTPEEVAEAKAAAARKPKAGTTAAGTKVKGPASVVDRVVATSKAAAAKGK